MMKKIDKKQIQRHSLDLHEARRGKITTRSTFKIKNKKEYRFAMSPGVATVAKKIAQMGEKGAYKYTIKSHTVAFVTDGSAVLGLGNKGPYSGITIVEGKSALLKEFSGIDGIPLSLNTLDDDEIVRTIEIMSPIFGAINLEDIAAPRCFYVEEKLKNLGIPVFHDDQHGAAIVVYAALLNSCKVLGKKLSDLKIVIGGAGAAGMATARMLLQVDNDGVALGLNYPKATNIIIVDRGGIISRAEKQDNKYKQNIAEITNNECVSGGLEKALAGADVFIGLSVGKTFKKSWIKTMSAKPIIFAMANPVPEITQTDAIAGGAFIYGSGRGDSKIQINNMLAYPGIFKGLLEKRAKRFMPRMKYKAALAIAGMVEDPSAGKLLPDPFKTNVVEIVAKSIK